MLCVLGHKCGNDSWSSGPQAPGAAAPCAPVTGTLFWLAVPIRKQTVPAGASNSRPGLQFASLGMRQLRAP